MCGPWLELRSSNHLIFVRRVKKKKKKKNFYHNSGNAAFQVMNTVFVVFLFCNKYKRENNSCIWRIQYLYVSDGLKDRGIGCA